MAKLFYTDIDLKGNQLLNPVFHKSVEYPVNPVEGQVFYSPTTKLSYQYIGVIDGQPTWIPLTGSVADLVHNDNRVVTSVSSDKGIATLGTKGLQELVFGVALPNIGTTALQSLQQVAETVDREIDNRVVRNGLWTAEGKLLVTNGTKGASETAYSIQGTALNPGSNDEVPTSTAIANYVGSLAGGLHYKGTVDANREDPDTDTQRKDLPENGIVNGDVWVVKTDGNYHVADGVTEAAQHGDLFVASVNNGTVTWSHIPLEFTVRSNDIQKLAPIDGLQEIATVDGTPIKLGLQKITVDPTATGEANGNAVDSISFDGNNVATLNKKYVLQNVSVSGDPGVIKEIRLGQDNVTLEVLQHSLAVQQPENLQYVKGLSQGDDGKISIIAGQFDQIIDATTGEHVAIAPSTKAVKDYVNNKIDDLDVEGLTVASKDANGMVHLQQVVKETDGKIELVDESDTLVLQKVASTGQAVDIKVPVNSGISVNETSVLGGLQGLQAALNNLGDHVVNSIQGIYGDMTLGNGLTIDTTNDKKEIKAKIKDNDYVTVDAEDGIQLDANKIDDSYDTENPTKLATVGSIQTAIDGLDVDEMPLGGTDTTTTPGTTVINLKGIYEVDGKIALQAARVGQSWNLKGTYNAANNQIALQSTITEVIQTLDGTSSIINVDDYTPQTGEVATKKIEFFEVKEVDGVLEQSDVINQTLYITKGVTAANPLVTVDDLGSSESNAISAHVVKNPALTGVSNICTWNINIGNVPQAENNDWDERTVVELRDTANAVVEADVTYDVANKKIVVRFNGSSYAADYFKLIVLTKNSYTVSNPA